MYIFKIRKLLKHTLMFFLSNCARQRKFKKLDDLETNLSKQYCCSPLYIKIFHADSCCCAWLDNGELFPA